MNLADIDIQAIIDRNDFLNRNVPRCVFCDAEQVQIISKLAPAEWKCRECRFEFAFEPPAGSLAR